MNPPVSAERPTAEQVLATAEALRWETGDFHEQWIESVYAAAGRIADRAVVRSRAQAARDLDRILDRIVTSRTWALPLMVLLFSLVFWITITGANVPSQFLSSVLIGRVHPALHNLADAAALPRWLSGFVLDGMYLATAWVVSVMLPPMAIFFPLFTLLEDFGYLPRVAFNLDHLFRRAGAHGKQSLSMMMGFGCNAAGVVATRVIDSPRERLIAILTNNFALCNGRWPTQVLVATLFLGTLAPAYLAGFVSAMAVVGVASLGVLITFAVSWALSRTALRGEVSTFSLELPPYRPPRIWTTIYTSVIDRTVFVLWRAVMFALPAGGLIWLSANLQIDGVSLAEHLIRLAQPFGLLIGLNGVVVVAYLLAIPANEIVIPTVLMLTVLTANLSGTGGATGVIFQTTNEGTLTLLRAGGWTTLTAVNLMLFSLLHNPCSTTLMTIYRETGSRKWMAAAALLPLALGVAVTFIVAQFWRLLGGAG